MDEWNQGSTGGAAGCGVALDIAAYEGYKIIDARNTLRKSAAGTGFVACLRRFLGPAALATMLSGCSFLFMDRPPPPAAGMPLPAGSTCSTSVAFPALDVIGGALGLGSALFAGSAEWAAVAVVLGASGGNGVRNVKRCREFLAIPYSDSTSRAPVGPPYKVSPVVSQRASPDSLCAMSSNRTRCGMAPFLSSDCGV